MGIESRSDATIYWFSGTGNSLAAARTIAGRLATADLVPIAAMPVDGPIAVEAGATIGIVCPVYFYGLPLIVREFMERLDPSPAAYTFVVLTMGGMPGVAIHHARELLRGRLDAAWTVRMPGNYIAEYNARSPRATRRLVDRATRRCEHIAAAVGERRGHRPWATDAFLPLGLLVHRLVGARFAQTCRRRDERFDVTDACISCGTCARVCPVGNVTIDEGRPRWHRACEQCFACIHLCPATAIQLCGRPTSRRRRYRHPDTSVEDIAAQRRGA